MSEELRILILEDVPTDAELMERELRKGGIKFSSKRVETREDFIKEIKDFAPDLILSDYMLPHFNGMAALELAKELAPTIPFIIVTGSINEETAVECMKAGAGDYVLKDHLGRIDPAVKNAIKGRWLREAKDQAEKALQTSAQEWQVTFDAISDPVCILDIERRILQCNKAMENLVGKPLNEILGHACCEFIHGKSEPLEGCPFLHVQKSYRRESIILPVVNQWFNVTVDPLIDGNGRLIGGVHIVSDITERKNMEKVLRESEERFRLAFENANIGMCLVDLQGRLTKVNRKMCGIFGYSQEELENMTVNDIAYPEDLNISPTFIQRATSGEIEHTNFEKRYFHKDCHIVWGQVSSSLVRDAQGVPQYFISHIEDITERKWAEAEREKLIRELQEALAQVKLLSGMLPICSSCKKVRDDKGYWNQIEVYIQDHSEAEFSHGICPECMKKLYPDEI